MEIIRIRVSMLYPPVGQLAGSAAEAAASSAMRLSEAALSAAALSASVLVLMVKAKATRTKM